MIEMQEGDRNDNPEKGKNNDGNVSDEIKQRRKTVRDLIDNVAIRLQAGIENGLFEQKGVKDNGPKWTDIQKTIEDARLKIEKNLDEAENLQERALGSYFEVLNKSGKSWRFFGLYAGHLWIFLVGILASIFFFYYYSIDDVIVSGILTEEHKVAIDVVVWGIIGSVLRCLWAIRFKVASTHYRKGWRLHYISAPFLGGILGAVVYILIYAGLVSVSNENFTPQNSLAMIPIAAYAGYRWEWAIRLFEKIEKIFESSTEEKDSKKTS
jgi:hypothetical protein